MLQQITRISQARAYTPVLNKIAQQFTNDKPLANTKIAIIFHLTDPVVQMLLTLVSAGADILFVPSKTETIVPASLDLLKQTGVKYIIPPAGQEAESLRQILAFKPDLLIDNANLFKLWHNENNPPPIVGATVHSRSAYDIVDKHRQAGHSVNYPIIGIGASELKLELESTLGTGQSVINALIKVSQLQLNGKKIAIVGYGNVGTGIAKMAQAMGAQVMIVETNGYRALKAKLFDGYEVMSLEQAIPQCDVMLTATGGKNIITEQYFGLFKPYAFIGNIGRYQEIDVSGLEKIADSQQVVNDYVTEYQLNGRSIYLMVAGHQLNHIAGEGNSSEIMDLSLALHVLAMEYLWTQREQLSAQIYTVPETITEQVALTKLQSLGVQMS